MNNIMVNYLPRSMKLPQRDFQLSSLLTGVMYAYRGMTTSALAFKIKPEVTTVFFSVPNL